MRVFRLCQETVQTQTPCARILVMQAGSGERIKLGVYLATWVCGNIKNRWEFCFVLDAMKREKIHKKNLVNIHSLSFEGLAFNCFSIFNNSFDQISGVECQEGLFGLECVRVEECGFEKSIMRYREEGNDETICNFSNFCVSLVFKFGKYILFYFLGIFRIVLIFGACGVRGFANRAKGEHFIISI